MRSFITLNILILFFYSCSEKKEAPAEAPQSVEVITIKGTSATTESDYTASLQGKSDVEIRPQVDGFLENVFVDEGEFVKAGQVLFEINDQPFREQYNSASANLQAALASITHAQLEIDKYTPLVQNKVVAEYQLKAAKAAFKIAEANAEQARANLATAKIKLGYTRITAPVSGYIGRIPRKKGSLVSLADPEALTEISDVQQIYAYFSLGETDFMNFNSKYPGNTLNEKLKKMPSVSLVLANNTIYPHPGKITMIDGRFDKNTGSITLRASFPKPEGTLRSGNTGKIRVPQQHKEAILIPQSATLDVQDKIFVYSVGDSNQVTKQPVHVIGKSGSDYIVKEGIKPGDKIVFKGLDHLIEGSVIKPVAVKSDQISISGGSE